MLILCTDAKAAELLKPDGIVLASVDATVEKKLSEKFAIKGFPTLKVFRGGEASEYKVLYGYWLPLCRS